MVDREKVKEILKILKKTYPHSKIALNFTNHWELLVATVLSAQCTDKRVNIVTKELFKKYKTIKDYAEANQKVFETDIRSVGFFRNKARNIITTAKIILEEFNGQVPDQMESLLKLPGIARKSANIILFNAFSKVVGIAVDTHVRRLSLRLGFTKSDDPNKIEKDLMELVPKGDWGLVSYLLIDHGRAICQAKKPNCKECVIGKFCLFPGL